MCQPSHYNGWLFSDNAYRLALKKISKKNPGPLLLKKCTFCLIVCWCALGHCHVCFIVAIFDHNWSKTIFLLCGLISKAKRLCFHLYACVSSNSFMDLDGGKSISRGVWRDGPKKVSISGPTPSNAPCHGLLHHPNPYVPSHINNRYINSYITWYNRDKTIVRPEKHIYSKLAMEL